MNNSSLDSASLDSAIDVAIVGAGPYGLSLSTHLAKTGLRTRIFGKTMQSWQDHMPRGMKLKSEGFASSIYDPDSAFPLSEYCRENNISYADIGNPVPLETFVAYGHEFQRRLVPHLEPVEITSIKPSSYGFTLTTALGEAFDARSVVLAVGITHFSYIPPMLAALPSEHISHTFDHSDLSQFQGRKVAVIGAGASAIDTAAALHEAGAHVEIITRASRIAFHSKGTEPRPLMERLRNPRSGLGVGWKSWLCSNLPLVFHRLPENMRLRATRRHLGPAPGWFVRDKVEGVMPIHLNAELQSASVENGQACLTFTTPTNPATTLAFDHIVAGTGFHPAITRLTFLDETLRSTLKTVEDTPILDRNFESSVPNLYFIGLAAANSFGPLNRFACGAEFTAKHLTQHLA